jgi:hypothetical protein
MDFKDKSFIKTFAQGKKQLSPLSPVKPNLLAVLL